ncbi:MAG: substrate-binding domain-containing protein [Oscillospiraceae bacterium]|nr:substrate-binding domain-containing protein [Oscillospiraceae bacterium]
MISTNARSTLEEIAEEIHISRTTIYKVLNNKGRVSEKTRQTVTEALKKYHYVPNNNARNLALNKAYRMACCYYESADAAYFAPAIHAGLRKAAAQYGDHGLTVQACAAGPQEPEKQEAFLLESLRSGIRSYVIAASDPERLLPVLQRLQQEGCTVVLLSKQIPGAPCQSFIGIDEYKAGRLAADLLGRMAFPGGTVQVLVPKESHANRYVTQNRLRGFTDGMQQFSEVCLAKPLEVPAGSAAMEAALEPLWGVTNLAGIFDLTYRLEAIAAALKKHGKAQIRLVGIDLTAQSEPYLREGMIDAVVFQDLKEQARLACSLLFRQMCYNQPIAQSRYDTKLEVILPSNLEYFIGRL